MGLVGFGSFCVMERGGGIGMNGGRKKGIEIEGKKVGKLKGGWELSME